MNEFISTTKEMGFRDSQASCGRIAIPSNKSEQDALIEGIRYKNQSAIQEKIDGMKTQLTSWENNRKEKGDAIDNLALRLPSSFNYSPLFFGLTSIMSLGMMIFAYAFYCSAFFNAFILDIADLQGLDGSNMGNIFSIFNKNAFQTVNIHLLVGSVFLGFSLLVEHYLGTKKIRPLVIISAILFIGDLLLIIQVERKTSMMAELIGFERTTDIYFYMTLVIFGFVSCFVLGILLNLLSKYYLGFKRQRCKKQLVKSGSMSEKLKNEISRLKTNLSELMNLSNNVILQCYLEGVNEHLVSRGDIPSKLSYEGNNSLNKTQITGLNNKTQLSKKEVY